MSASLSVSKALAVAPVRAFTFVSKNTRIIRDRSRVSQRFSLSYAEKFILTFRDRSRIIRAL